MGLMLLNQGSSAIYKEKIIETMEIESFWFRAMKIKGDFLWYVMCKMKNKSRLRELRRKWSKK